MSAKELKKSVKLTLACIKIFQNQQLPRRIFIKKQKTKFSGQYLPMFFKKKKRGNHLEQFD